MSDWVDSDGYPTDEALERLENWPYTDTRGALDFMAECWHWPDFVSRVLSAAECEIVHAEHGDKFIRFATGGWSGNESLIRAFEGRGLDDVARVNAMLRRSAWRLSAAGGLHIYEYPM